MATDGLTVGWFSCGCSSLVACAISDLDVCIYIHVADQHPDTLRFLHDAERLLGAVTVLSSEDYVSVDDVIEHKRYINGPAGAACTLLLKKRVRQAWEIEHWGHHTYVWGYDVTERRRAERLVYSMPEFEHSFPLIDAGLTKADCHALCADWGIRRPSMYDMGYPNNNCVGCVKGGMGYWNRIREDFPDVFERRAKQERLVGHSCINGTFLDELPVGVGRERPVVPACSIDCYVSGLSGVYHERHS